VEDGVTAYARVCVEVLMLLADPDGQWSYRRICVEPGPGMSPDEAARRAGGVRPDAAAYVVHSTSWRYLPTGTIVLTYAVCPDPQPQARRVTLASFDLARGSTPAAPTPENIEIDNVVAHAIGHLAFLMSTDPVVRQALRQWPAIAMALESRAPLAAGELDGVDA
jgi:hypothetical protein